MYEYFSTIAMTVALVESLLTSATVLIVTTAVIDFVTTGAHEIARWSEGWTEYRWHSADKIHEPFDPSARLFTFWHTGAIYKFFYLLPRRIKSLITTLKGKTMPANAVTVYLVEVDNNGRPLSRAPQPGEYFLRQDTGQVQRRTSPGRDGMRRTIVSEHVLSPDVTGLTAGAVLERRERAAPRPGQYYLGETHEFAGKVRLAPSSSSYTQPRWVLRIKTPGVATPAGPAPLPSLLEFRERYTGSRGAAPRSVMQEKMWLFGWACMVAKRINGDWVRPMTGHNQCYPYFNVAASWFKPSAPNVGCYVSFGFPDEAKCQRFINHIGQDNLKKIYQLFNTAP